MHKMQEPSLISTNCKLLYLASADFIVRTAYQMGKTPLLPLFAVGLGANTIFLGFIVSASTLTGMLLKPLFGLLSDRWGRWIWFFIGTLLFSIVPLFYLWVENANQLLILRLFHGTATAIYGPVTVAWVVEQGKEESTIDSNCAERLGWFGMARSSGYILGPLLGAAMLTVFEPEVVFVIIGILSSFSFLPILLLKNRCIPVRTFKSWRLQFKDALRSGFQTAEIWFAGLLEFAVFLGLYSAKAFLPLYALQQNISILWVGLFFTTQELTHILVRPFGGRLSDRKGYLPVISAGLSLAALSLGLIPFATSTQPLLLLAVGFGLAQALIFPSIIALYAQKIDSRHTGAGAGIIGSFKNAGKIAGPIIGGLIIDWHDLSWMLWIMAALLMVWSLGLLLNTFSKKFFIIQW
ncbi:MAG: MFS transporter [Deltaproteobacteria bacterium]|nr:MFS transporter [Deltaproteobacteria bacterium]